MSLEELYNYVKRFKEREANYEALYKGFSKKLPTELTEVVFKHLSEFRRQKVKYKKAVLKIAKNYAGQIWEVFNSANYLKFFY